MICKHCTSPLFWKIQSYDTVVQRPRHASSETDMPHRRPTFFIGDRLAPSETDMPHRKPTCPIWDQHAFGDPSETNIPAESNRNLNTYIFKYTYFYIHTFCLFIYVYRNKVRTLFRHVSLWWVSDQSCRSLMGHVFSNGSPIRQDGLRSSMSISDGVPISFR